MNNLMNSKEFIEKYDISLKKLERLEKSGIITPKRISRIRYYGEEQCTQYENYASKTPTEKFSLKENLNVVVFSENNNVLKFVKYCSEHGISVDMNYVYKDNQNIQEIINIFENYDINRVLYCSEGIYGNMIKMICNSYGVLSEDIKPKNSENPIICKDITNAPSTLEKIKRMFNGGLRHV